MAVFHVFMLLVTAPIVCGLPSVLCGSLLLFCGSVYLLHSPLSVLNFPLAVHQPGPEESQDSPSFWTEQWPRQGPARHGPAAVGW